MGKIRINRENNYGYRFIEAMVASVCKMPAEDMVWLNEVHGGNAYLEKNSNATLDLDEKEDFLRNDWLALQKAFDVNPDFSVLEKISFDKKLRSISLRPLKKSQ